jgi:hypothetical protein
MNALNIYAKINTLLPTILKEVDVILDFLKTKQKSTEKIKECEFG